MDAETLKEKVIELEVDDIGGFVQQALEENMKPLDILAALTSGMDEVGRRYDAGEYFLTEIVLAGETMKEAIKVLEPSLKGEESSRRKVPIILATVKGDQH